MASTCPAGKLHGVRYGLGDGRIYYGAFVWNAFSAAPEHGFVRTSLH